MSGKLKVKSLKNIGLHLEWLLLDVWRFCLRYTVCPVKGHIHEDYFCTYTLDYCRRCGREFLDRGWDDIEPMPDELHDEFERMEALSE